MTYAELRRAHLLLCLFAHAYVWGGPEPLDHIPEGIARPLWEVSQRLGMPPVLGECDGDDSDDKSDDSGDHYDVYSDSGNK